MLSTELTGSASVAVVEGESIHWQVSRESVSRHSFSHLLLRRAIFRCQERPATVVHPSATQGFTFASGQRDTSVLDLGVAASPPKTSITALGRKDLALQLGFREIVSACAALPAL